MDEIIIVGVDNTPDRIDELTYSYDSTVPGGGKGDLYLDFIETTVLPIIEVRIYCISTLYILKSYSFPSTFRKIFECIREYERIWASWARL